MKVKWRHNRLRQIELENLIICGELFQEDGSSQWRYNLWLYHVPKSVESAELSFAYRTKGEARKAATDRVKQLIEANTPTWIVLSFVTPNHVE